MIKINHKFYPLITFSLLALFLVACGGGSGGKKSDSPETNINKIVSVTGLIRTSDRFTIEGVEAYNNEGTLATSDKNGAISFTVEAEKASSIRLRKTGYAAQTVVLEVNNEKAAFLATLGKRNAAITLNADAEIELTDNTGARVKMEAGALVDANGKKVTGDIQLNMTPVDVSNKDEAGIFPGAFAGTDIDGKVAPVIMSYGTVEYHFTQNGKKLNLASGQEATIEIPVFVKEHADGSLIKIGDKGALWSLDEMTGQWLQENVGIIVKSIQSPTGMALQTTVTHFSWWNHDVAPQTCDLSISSTGLPTNASANLGASTNSPYTRPSANTHFGAEGKVVIVPRGTKVGFSASAVTAEGSYTATAQKKCDGEVGNLRLDFDGPKPPGIIYFAGYTKPIFKKGTDDRWFLERNDALFVWEVIGEETLLLSSDQGHSTTLGSHYGATSFPLELNAMHVSSYAFTLTATGKAGNTTERVTLDYMETPKPIVTGAWIFNTPLAMHLYWDSEGADTLSIGYVNNGDSPETATIVKVDIDANLRVELLDKSLFPAGSDIVLIFTNQYGKTYKQFILSECSEMSDMGCSIEA